MFFYGAEFAPYAAAERWPLALALSRFGTFTQLGLMQSSPTTAFADLSTFTLWQARYASKYVVLEHVERYSALNPTGAGYLKLEKPVGRQAAAVAKYSSSPTNFALLDVGNRWELNGSSYAPSVLTGMTQDEVAAVLTSPMSPLAQALLASANEISAAICNADGQAPSSVCDSKGVVAADQVPEDRATRPRRRTESSPRAARACARGRATRQRNGTVRLCCDQAELRPACRKLVQLARRSSISLRSTSLSPPQIPCGSRIRMA